jgi:hypothetical protein
MHFVTIVPRNREDRFAATVTSIPQNGTAIWGHPEKHRIAPGDRVTFVVRPVRANPASKGASSVFERNFTVRTAVEGVVAAVGNSVPKDSNGHSFVGCRTKYALNIIRRQQDVAITASAENKGFCDAAGKASGRHKVVSFTGRGAFPPVS